MEISAPDSIALFISPSLCHMSFCYASVLHISESPFPGLGKKTVQESGGMASEQWFPTFRMLRSFNTGPQDVVTLHHKIIFITTS